MLLEIDGQTIVCFYLMEMCSYVEQTVLFFVVIVHLLSCFPFIPNCQGLEWKKPLRGYNPLAVS